MRTKAPKSQSATTRQLDDSELERIVGGVATAAARREQFDHLVQQDLVGHDAGQNHAGEIAAMIASGAIAAKDAIHDIEGLAARDGKHSADQQLVHVHDALNKAHATAASAAFAHEEDARLGNGTAAQDLGRLIAKGAMSVGAAINVVTDEGRVSGSHKVGAAMAGLETATHGNASVEVALGHLVRSGQESANDAIRTVTAAATSAHKSVDQALSYLDAGAGHNATIEATELHRVVTHATEADFVSALRHGTITGAGVVGVLASDVAHGAFNEKAAVGVLLAVEKGAANAAIETELGNRVKTHDAVAAQVIAAVETGAARAHASAGHALERVETAAGGNAAVEVALGQLIKSGHEVAADAIRTLERAAVASHHSVDAALSHLDEGAVHNKAVEAEERHRVATHATETDLAAALKRGTISGADVVGTLASEVAHGAIKEKDAINVLLAVEKAGGNAAIETELGHRIKTHEAMAAQVVAAVEAGAAKVHASIGHALERVEIAAGGDAAVETALGRAIKAGHEVAADAITTVENVATATHHSIDQALGRLDAGAGHNRAVETEERLRVLGGQTEENLVSALRNGTINGAGVVAALASEVSHGAIKEADAIRVLLALEKNHSDPAIETELGHRIKTHDVTPAQVIAAVESAAGHAPATVMQILQRVETAAGSVSVVENAMRARLTSGEAAASLADLVSHGMSATNAAAILVAEHHKVAPATAGVAHSLSVLMDQMWLKGVPQQDINAVAKANASTIVAGVIAEVKGAGTPSQADIEAAATVFEAGLTKFSSAALAHVEAPFKALEATAEGRGVLTRIHTIALNNAVDDHTLTPAQAQQWAHALVVPEPAAPAVKLDATSQVVYGVLDQMVRGSTSGYDAMNTLSQKAATMHTTVSNLLQHTAGQISDDKHALALMEVAKVSLFNYLITDQEQAAVNSKIVTELAKPGHELDKAITGLANDVASGKVNSETAGAAMLELARSLPYVMPTADLLKATAANLHDNAQTATFLKLLDAVSAGGAIGDYDLGIVRHQILVDMADSNHGAIDPKSLIDLTISTVGFGSTSEAEARSFIAHAAAAAGRENADQWLSSALAAAGGLQGAGNTNAAGKVVLSILDVMADRVSSGALAADAAHQVQEGRLTAGQAVDFVSNFARQALSNNGFDATGYGFLTQVTFHEVGGRQAQFSNAKGADGQDGDQRVSHALHDLIIASHGDTKVEQAAAKQAVVIEMDRHLLVDATIKSAGPLNVDKLSALTRMDGYIGGTDHVFAQEIGRRMGSGGVADITNAMVDRVLTPAAASQLVATAIERMSEQRPSAAFETHLADKLLDGSAESALARAVAKGNISGHDAIGLASEALKLVDQTHGTRLPGAAEAEYVIAKLDSAALANHATGLHTELTQTYGLALSIGKVIAPLVDEIGVPLATAALNAGTKLHGIADPTTGGEAATIVSLETAVHRAGASIDAALTLAAMNAAGRSEVLKLEITDRLLSGKAETDIAKLEAAGKLSPAGAVQLLTTELQVLVTASHAKAALGFDQTTAKDYVLAKLNLAAEALQGPGDHVPGAGRSADLQRYLETNYLHEVIAGAGAVAGILAIDVKRNATAIATAEAMAQRLMPESVNQGLAQIVDGPSMSRDEVQEKIAAIAKENVQTFTDAYDKAYNLASFEKEWTFGHQSSVSGSLQTYNFTELGAQVGVSADLMANLGAGFSLQLSASAGASASVSINATQVTIEAAAGASASAEVDLGSHAKFAMLAQAIASGSIVAGVTGVAVSGNVAVGASATLSQGEQGSLGVSGLEGMQTTTLTAGVVAGASGTAAIGLNNAVNFSAKVGAYASAGEQGSISYGGVTVGGGITIASPGVVGAEANIDVSFEHGDIGIHLSGFIGIELFGVGFNLDFTLPTGKILDALKSLGGYFEDFGNGVADFFTGKLF